VPVNTPCAAYDAAVPLWDRCRDVMAGSDAVKAGGTKYLPALAGQTQGLEGYKLTTASASHKDYAAYLLRAMFTPVGMRTAWGLAGLVFSHPPTLANVPKSSEEDLADVTRTGVSLLSFALDLCLELLHVGRAGVLLDMPPEGSPRPYWVLYRAEQIINWRTTRIAGQEYLTLLVLSERVPAEVQDDAFTVKLENQYRVLRLVNLRATGETREDAFRYEVQLYREDPNHKQQFIEYGPLVVPTRRGEPLSYIPFTFIGPSGVTPQVEHPVLLDLVDVILSHYRNSADLEWGMHFTALPTPYAFGITLKQGETLAIGPTEAWVHENANAKAGMLEYGGQGLGSIEKAMERKNQLMIVLGARMLESQKNAPEAAATVRLRNSGEGSVLAVLATSLGQALTQTLRWHLFWAGLEEDVARAATITLNPDAKDELTADEIRALVTSWQAGAISRKTLLENLAWGEWLREGVTIEEEIAEIERETPEPPPMPPPNRGGVMPPELQQ
jgi:hypothetical protein